MSVLWGSAKRFAHMILWVLGSIHAAAAAEISVRSPDGSLALVVSDEPRLAYRVESHGKPLLVPSALGLALPGEEQLGPDLRLGQESRSRGDSVLDNPFGKRRRVADRWNEVRVSLLTAHGTPERNTPLALVLRAYDDGVAFRYELPEKADGTEHRLEGELTEFRFASDFRCWAGDESSCAENGYPERTLSTIPALSSDKRRPYHSVLPLLVEMPDAYVAIAEADLRDWAGLFLSGTGGPAVRATLAPRTDGRGAVLRAGKAISPWRVIQVSKTPAHVLDSDLLALLAAPNAIGDTSWIQPGACAWDAWWTGVNPALPQHTGVYARGDTTSHKAYIDLAADMGWPYQLIDWFWYENMTSFNKTLHSKPNEALADFTRSVPAIDLPALVEHAQSKGVRLWVWAHSLDMRTFGVEAALDHFAKLGVAGVKVDFFNSDSQETVRWCEDLLAAAAKRKLLIDLHGVHKPGGLARTYPNFLTQEGVLGNEYNKLHGAQCTIRHTVTLPFTRGLLGPMDFTPGGFRNRTPATFRITHPAEVIGTRTRQLAMTVVYFSPLQVLCDSPENYRGQPGLGFLRSLPTVWDDTVVLQADVARSVVIARRSGERWWLGALNDDAPLELTIDLAALALPAGSSYQVRSYADGDDPEKPETVLETTAPLSQGAPLHLKLQSGGGYAAVLEPVRP